MLKVIVCFLMMEVIVKTLSDNEPEAICTVTELVKRLKLSRARFYQLLEKGVFPKPTDYTHTKRPFYTLDLQQKCLEIRKTGIGFNGKPVIFNTPRKIIKPNGCDNGWDSKFNEFCGELVEVLKQMGLKMTRDKVKNALQEIYHDGLERLVVDGELIRDLFGYFKSGCKKSV